MKQIIQNYKTYELQVIEVPMVALKKVLFLSRMSLFSYIYIGIERIEDYLIA